MADTARSAPPPAAVLVEVGEESPGDGDRSRPEP